MASMGTVQYAYRAWLAKPVEDRVLFRLAKKHRIASIVEMGVSRFERTLELIRACQRFTPAVTIKYTGLDAFDERSGSGDKLSLIDAHRRLKAIGANPRLMPGGPTRALPAVANSVMGADLVLISPAATDAELIAVWSYMPRICADHTVVLRGGRSGDSAGAGWNELSHADRERFASAAKHSKAA